MQASALMEATTPAAPAATPGAAMRQRIRELYPICRSITGDGVRQTLARLGRDIPLQVHEVPSGTTVLDWTVPREWNIRDAWIKNAAGERVVDFAAHNLHVVSYSVPVRARMRLADLQPHLHSLPEHPDWIPYRTSYYAEEWGFCLTHRQREALTEPDYDVCIDSELRDGSLSYGECVLPGRIDAEVLVSAHICHPSLANDNLSGVTVAAELARYVASTPRRYTYRFVFAPGTIGAITWLAQHEQQTPAIAHGLVLAGVGGPGGLTYKRSRRGDAAIDRAMAHVLRQAGAPHAIQDFSPYGHDERQYCSPGFNLPVGCLMRAPWGTYPEYHTSADSIEFVSEASLVDSLDACMRAVDVLEGDGLYVNQQPKGEVQLGRRGLYRKMGGGTDGEETQLATLWVLNFSDGHHTLLDIADRANMPFASIRRAADLLVDASLLSCGPAPQADAAVPRHARAHEVS
jgi:aminopeptidase-like protein